MPHHWTLLWCTPLTRCQPFIRSPHQWEICQWWSFLPMSSLYIWLSSAIRGTDLLTFFNQCYTSFIRSEVTMPIIQKILIDFSKVKKDKYRFYDRFNLLAKKRMVVTLKSITELERDCSDIKPMTSQCFLFFFCSSMCVFSFCLICSPGLFTGNILHVDSAPRFWLILYVIIPCMLTFFCTSEMFCTVAASPIYSYDVNTSQTNK